MKKILWLSNRLLTDEKTKSSGTWLSAMMEALIATGEVQLYNITQGDVKEFTRKDCKEVIQWVIPQERPTKSGLPSQKTIDFIKKIETEINPDLIHIWGTENYWAMLAAKKILTKPILVDMQGILNTIVKVFYADLTFKELLGCIGLKEIILPSRFLYFRKNELKRMGINERFVIQNLSYISVQSDWVRAYIENENPKSKIYPTGIILRKEFYESQPWAAKDFIDPIIFTSSSGFAPAKGLHVLFRAMAVLKHKYPTIKLRIAGNHNNNKLFTDGYSKWLNKEAKKLGIFDSIEWLGPLDVDEIILELHAASVVVIPSFVESYSLALAEAIFVGVPTVVSYAGAMTEAAQHNESALYFPVGDFMACSWQIQKLLANNSLSEKLSGNARNFGLVRNDPQKIVKRQLEIYNEVMSRQ